MVISRIGCASMKAKKMVFLAYDLKHPLNQIIVLKIYVKHNSIDELISGAKEIVIHEELMDA